MIGSQSQQASLTQRTGFALAEALRQERAGDLLLANGRIRRISDLLIDGVHHEQLPNSIDRTRLRSPHSATALAVNSFLRWQGATDQLPLAGWTGFDAVQFEVRCPTGLRGTPPHLDLLALRGEAAIAVTVRCIEYLSRRKTAVAPSYDQLLATTPGLEPWRRQLERLRTEPQRFRHVDSGALIKFALALGRTFPERPTTLLYLYWEPLDADQFEEFGRHREEATELADAVRDARVTFAAQSFAAMWRDWAARTDPSWLAAHVDRLRARYCVRVAPGKHL
jgi:FAD/FMN-containing dehydrogenase